MFDFNKPKIEITEISEDKKFGRFVVEPLERCIYLKLRSNLPALDLHSVGWYQNNYTDRRTFSRSSVLLPYTDRR